MKTKEKLTDEVGIEHVPELDHLGCSWVVWAKADYALEHPTKTVRSAYATADEATEAYNEFKRGVLRENPDGTV